MNGVPEAWTRVPGAWLAMQTVAVSDTRNTGRGSCGRTVEAGRSRQMRQARIDRRETVEVGGGDSGGAERLRGGA